MEGGLDPLFYAVRCMKEGREDNLPSQLLRRSNNTQVSARVSSAGLLCHADAARGRSVPGKLCWVKQTLG